MHEFVKGMKGFIVRKYKVFKTHVFFLKVNNVQRDFILDSVEAVQIEECNSFLCLSNPCKNFGACEEVDGKITCKCAAG